MLTVLERKARKLGAKGCNTEEPLPSPLSIFLIDVHIPFTEFGHKLLFLWKRGKKKAYYFFAEIKVPMPATLLLLLLCFASPTLLPSDMS